MTVPTLRYPDTEQKRNRQLEDAVAVQAVIASKRETRRLLAAPPPPPGMDPAAPPPAAPVALGGPPMPPPALPPAPTPAIAPAQSPMSRPTGGTVGDLALATAQTAPNSLVTNELAYAHGGVVPAARQFPKELERHIVTADELFRMLIAQQPITAYATGGMVNTATIEDMEDDEADEEEALLALVEQQGPAPEAFIAFLENPPQDVAKDELVSDLAAALARSPESAPMLYAIVQRMAARDPQALPPALLALVRKKATAPAPAASSPSRTPSRPPSTPPMPPPMPPR